MSEIYKGEPIYGNWEGKDFISINQLSKDDVLDIYDEARAMRNIREQKIDPQLLNNQYQLANVFFEASTRTSMSFESGWKRLGAGAGVSAITNVTYSSVSKGESLVHTLKTLERYSEALVIRHSQVGAAAIAAQNLDIPVLNAGDGVGEHPSQGLLDGFTMFDTLGGIDDKDITIAGDLKHGRTTHSLVQFLSMFNPKKVNLVAPNDYQMPEQYVDMLADKGIEASIGDDLDAYTEETDALYMVRLQRERIKQSSDLPLREQIEKKVEKILLHGTDEQKASLDDKFKDSLKYYLEIAEDNSNKKDSDLAGLVLYSILNTLPDIKTLDAKNGFNDNIYVLDKNMVDGMKQDARIYHPLPIAGEIAKEVDKDHRAVYFDQVENGMYVRMALLARVLGKSVLDKQ
jgi:aspartate carbamoyltransferase catalytic subunit